MKIDETRNAPYVKKKENRNRIREQYSHIKFSTIHTSPSNFNKNTDINKGQP